jgi:hypothetical protein
MSDVQPPPPPLLPQATLDALLSELESQRQRAGGWSHENKPVLSAEVLIILELADQLRREWYKPKNDVATMHVMRKIGGVAVRCMNNHGAYKREPEQGVTSEHDLCVGGAKMGKYCPNAGTAGIL